MVDVSVFVDSPDNSTAMSNVSESSRNLMPLSRSRVVSAVDVACTVDSPDMSTACGDIQMRKSSLYRIPCLTSPMIDVACIVDTVDSVVTTVARNDAKLALNLSPVDSLHDW